MPDNFFEKHDFSIGMFVVGIAVIMFIMFGGGMAPLLVVLSMQQLLGEFTSKELVLYIGILELIMNFCIVVPNIMIIRGRPRAAKVNQINIYFQFACYLLFSLIFEHQYKWFCLSFVIFPLLANWLMTSAKYQAFLAYYEAIRKDPAGLRRSMEKMLE
jgi:hypothetical protein